MLKYVLLGFLSYRPLTGYDLKRIIDTSTRHFWHADLSQIYKTLKMLEASSLIMSSVEAQDERPDRRVYTITEAGRADLKGWLDTPLTEMTPLKEALLLKVFFSAGTSPESVLAQLRQQRSLHQQALAHFQGQTTVDIEHNAQQMGAQPLDALYWDATRRAGVLYEEMYIRWLDETIMRLSQQRTERE